MIAKELIWNPYTEGYFASPRKFLRRWREANPVHKGISGSWLLLKYNDVKFLLTSPVFETWKTHEAIAEANRQVKKFGNFKALSVVFSNILLFQDPPEQGQQRLKIAKIWNLYSLNELIEESVQESLESLTGKNHVDLVAEYARAVPTKIISKILGLPASDFVKITNWSHQFISALEPFVSLRELRVYNREAARFYRYLNRQIDGKMAQPDEFFISRLLTVNETFDEPWSRDEIISILCMLFFAGIETSVNLLSQSVLALLKDPVQLDLARVAEKLTLAAAGELIRYVSPVNYTKRVATQAVDIRGCRIKAGESLFAAIISANFDEEIFDCPERLDLTRSVNPHLGFGHGAHFCLGARLGREQISRSVPALLRRFPNMTLSSEKQYQWDKLIMNRALETLPVSLNDCQ